MFIEAITLSAIIGASAFAVWFARARFQPEIERSLTKIESAGPKQETIYTKKRLNNKIN
ncbi:MAG: hypothetical protein M3239_04490 [Thermoproteota archaeon]|nr:hypothetical protein [Thermoproteota archaeon]